MEAGWVGKETMSSIGVPQKEGCRWDLVTLGEVMLRFDPGEYRIWTTRQFTVSEGSGEYNVARGLKHRFRLDTAIVTAFAKNPVGALVQGDTFVVRGGVEHGASALEESLVIDVFTPCREDYLK
jgi:2-dehydro-3-deoxygluconokinase